MLRQAYLLMVSRWTPSLLLNIISWILTLFYIFGKVQWNYLYFGRLSLNDLLIIIRNRQLRDRLLLCFLFNFSGLLHTIFLFGLKSRCFFQLLFWILLILKVVLPILEIWYFREKISALSSSEDLQHLKFIMIFILYKFVTTIILIN